MAKGEPSVWAILGQLWENYNNDTAHKTKVIDAFLLYVLFTGIIQFVYVGLVGTFPFNSFLSGFLSCVGQFVALVNLRLQTDPKSPAFGFSRERAFADFIFMSLVLHLTVMNFMG